MSADRSITGRIFDIQRYSLHDGPGIRTIVFLKGCALRCRWCCNPESQSAEIETMATNGITRKIGRDVTLGEVMDIVLSDRPYYRRSGGGMTLSGGEALCQPGFAVPLLEACQNEGIHTAMETAGSIAYPTVERYLPYLDVCLLDIKHLDADKHKRFTGAENRLILENARCIAQNARKTIIRIPVVPTFNDTPEAILSIVRFIKSLPRVREVHLLPYHRLGEGKYKGLGRSYSYANVVPPSQADMEILLRVVHAEGLEGQVGG